MQLSWVLQNTWERVQQKKAFVHKGTVTSLERALSSPVLERGGAQDSLREGKHEGTDLPSCSELSPQVQDPDCRQLPTPAPLTTNA